MHATAFEDSPKVHAYAMCYAPIEGDNYLSTLASVNKNGIRQPIVFDKNTGKLIDGRNRMRIAEFLQIIPPVVYLDFKNDEEIEAFINDANEHRRHETVSQIAFRVAEQAAYFEEKNAAKQVAGLKQGGTVSRNSNVTVTGETREISTSEPEPAPANPLPTVESLAQQAGVSQKQANKANQVRKRGSAELQQAAVKGTVSVNAAYKVLDLPHDKQLAACTRKGERKPRKKKDAPAAKDDNNAEAAKPPKPLGKDPAGLPIPECLADVFSTRMSDDFNEINRTIDQLEELILAFADKPYGVSAAKWH